MLNQTTSTSTGFTARDALLRAGSYPSTAIIGPTGAGKSELINVLVNSVMAKVIAIGIGEKNQTTLISTNYVLDSRIQCNDQFALQLNTKHFNAKQVMLVLHEQLLKIFIENSFTADDTVDCMNEEWFIGLLELDELGQLLLSNLKSLIKSDELLNKEILLLENAMLDDLNRPILRKLFDPKAPFSLIVHEMIIACSPREELVKLRSTEQPFRFCLRDTVGLTQTGTDNESIQSALEIGMNYRSDSLLILFSLEERDDVLINSCNLIAGQAKLDLDTYVNEIAKSIPDCKSQWISRRFRDPERDPIQLALKEKDQSPFKPDGIYQFIDKLVQKIQANLLPAGISSLQQL